MKILLFILVQVAFCSVSFAQGKDTDDKEVVAVRPSVYPELDKAKLLCMKSCPVEMKDFMGVKVVCENFSRDEYQQNCSATVPQTAEYCNCTQTDCARFSVSCTESGAMCHVSMVAQGLQPLMCECSGRTCEQAAIESPYSACVIRRDIKSQLCSLDSYGTQADGNALYTNCENQNSCASEQVQTAVMNKPPMAAKKPSEPK